MNKQWSNLNKLYKEQRSENLHLIREFIIS